jgi:DNA-directed RNA polymerase subunit alpha
VLLSSLEGSAAVSVRIEGVQHEFSTLEYVREDIVQILLHIKQIRFQLDSDEPMKVFLKKKGECVVTAGDIETSTGIAVVNPDHIIAHLTDKKAKFEMEIEVQKGLGYVPVEQQEREEKMLGVIAIDAIFTPIKRVNFTVDNVRVGKRTDYEKIQLDIETDGTVSPKEAFDRAVHILVNQFQSLNPSEKEMIDVK